MLASAKWGMPLGRAADDLANVARVRDGSALQTLRVNANLVILVQGQVA